MDDAGARREEARFVKPDGEVPDGEAALQGPRDILAVAFVDVGEHQDGLVHISQLAGRYVKDPAEVVKVGQRVTVRVLSVELERDRLGLSMNQHGTSAAG